MLISNGNHPALGPPARRHHAHRPPAAPGGGRGPQPVAHRRAGHDRAPRAPHPERAGHHRARTAPHRPRPPPPPQARDPPPRGERADRPRRRSRRPALVAGLGDARRPRPAASPARQQGGLPGPPARPPRRRRARRARPRRGDPGEGAGGVTTLRRSFTSLSVRNYRRYFTGQVVSLAGNWMQIVAETWLVLKLT